MEKIGRAFNREFNLDAIADEINHRPRKRLRAKSPLAVYRELRINNPSIPLSSIEIQDVALHFEPAILSANVTQHLPRQKRDILKAIGRLACKACKFDFGAGYGEVGTGFCEVYHLKPLASRDGNETASLKHLAIFCSNCHSIIHRTSPMWPVTDLAADISSRASADNAPLPVD
jgi:5-methylcytosine-specific restriction endonuclease McrA